MQLMHKMHNVHCMNTDVSGICYTTYERNTAPNFLNSYASSHARLGIVQRAKLLPQNRSDRKHIAHLALNMSAGQNRKHFQQSNLRPARRKKTPKLSA
jgi:hypothetical protein